MQEGRRVGSGAGHVQPGSGGKVGERDQFCLATSCIYNQSVSALLMPNTHCGGNGRLAEARASHIPCRTFLPAPPSQEAHIQTVKGA